MRTPFKALVLCGLLSSAAVFADGSGTLNEATQKLTYDGGPYYLPNLTPFPASTTGQPPVCEPDTQTCDVYLLTIEFSDEFRSAQPDAFVDVVLEYASHNLPDPATAGASTNDMYDLFLNDSSDNPAAPSPTGATVNNPEVISLPLEALPNGTYRVIAIPFIPAAGTFTTTTSLSGLQPAAKSGLAGLFAGGLGASLLLPLALLGFRKPR